MSSGEAETQNDLSFKEMLSSDSLIFNSKLFIDFDGFEEITTSTTSNTSESQENSEPQSPILKKKISDCLSNELIEELETPFTLHSDNSEKQNEIEVTEKIENKENSPKFKFKNKFNQYCFFYPCYVTCDEKNNKFYVNPFISLDGRYNEFYCNFGNEKKTKKRNFVEREGDWTCFFCKNLNFSFRKKCNICGAGKEVENKEKNKEKNEEKIEEKTE